MEKKERKGLGLTVMDGIKFGLGMLIANIIALLVAGVLLIVLMLFGVIATGSL